jgi:hypothetical protein
MKQKQPTQHSSTSETTAQRQSVERPEQPRRLRIDLLEARVAPIAIWGE